MGKLGNVTHHAFCTHAGVNVDVRDVDGMTPLFAAAFGGSVEAIRALLRAGANPLLGSTRRSELPIHWAALQGSSDAVTLFIDAGVDVNAATNEGETPLHFASFNGEVDVIHTLLRAGANKNAMNGKGETPYDVARDERCKRALLGRR